MLPFELTKDTPYLALSGELWSVFYEYFNRNLSCYKGFLLYLALVNITAADASVLQAQAISIHNADSLVHDHMDLDVRCLKKAVKF